MTENKKINIKIEDVSKENPFGVPEHYFENFTFRMADKISQLEEKKVSQVSLSWLRPQYAVIMITSLVLLFTMGIYFFNQPHIKKLSVNEFKHNIELSIVSDMDENELIGQLEVVENASVLPVDSLTNNPHENSKLIIDEYLSKEDIDINTIEDAL